MDCEICTLIQHPSKSEIAMCLLEGHFWRATLRQNDQEYLGTTFITTKRHVEALPNLTQDEEREFIVIRNAIIAAQMEAFGAKVVNVSCLMNNAFQKAHPSPHVHYHLKPRYSQPVTVGSELFIDRQFGHYINEKNPHPVSLSTARLIIKQLRLYLPI